MPAAVQTKSRANRIKLFKKWYRHSTPNFRCYHGSRLPPRAMEGLWKHSKFFASQIKTGVSAKPKVKKSLLDMQLKAKPAKREKRGAVRKTETGKAPVVIKKLKRKKYVQFGKGPALHKQAAQEAREYTGRAFAGARGIAIPAVPGAAVGRQQFALRQPARTYGARGDPLAKEYEAERVMGRRTGKYLRKVGPGGRKTFRPRSSRRIRTV